MRNAFGVQFMETLAVGAFLTAFAIQLGASNAMIGLLAAIPHLSGFVQFAAVPVLERVRSRKAVYTWAGWVARPMLLVIASAALIPSSGIALAVIATAFAVRYAAGAFMGCAWSSWMRDLIPESRRGEIFARRQRVMTMVAMTMSICAGAFVDAWRAYVPAAPSYVYSLLYVAAFVGGAYAMLASRRIAEPPMGTANTASGRSTLEAMLRPFRDQNFRRLIGFLSTWNFAVNLAAPMFTVHMIKGIGLQVATIMVLATLSQLASYVTFSYWGAIADRFSNKSVLRVCGPLFIACIFAWTFTMFPNRHALTVPLLVAIHILTGVATAGVSLAGSNIALKLAPAHEATGYIAASAACNAASAGIASLLGGLTSGFFLARELTVVARWSAPTGEHLITAMSISHWDFYFLLACAFGLYALHRLSMVREEGSVHESVVVDEFFGHARRGMRSLSTVAGIRALTEFPLGWFAAKDSTRQDRRVASARRTRAAGRERRSAPGSAHRKGARRDDA